MTEQKLLRRVIIDTENHARKASDQRNSIAGGNPCGENGLWPDLR